MNSWDRIRAEIISKGWEDIETDIAFNKGNDHRYVDFRNECKMISNDALNAVALVIPESSDPQLYFKFNGDSVEIWNRRRMKRYETTTSGLVKYINKIIKQEAECEHVGYPKAVGFFLVCKGLTRFLHKKLMLGNISVLPPYVSLVDIQNTNHTSISYFDGIDEYVFDVSFKSIKNGQRCTVDVKRTDFPIGNYTVSSTITYKRDGLCGLDSKESLRQHLLKHSINELIRVGELGGITGKRLYQLLCLSMNEDSYKFFIESLD